MRGSACERSEQAAKLGAPSLRGGLGAQPSMGSRGRAAFLAGIQAKRPFFINKKAENRGNLRC